MQPKTKRSAPKLGVGFGSLSLTNVQYGIGVGAGKALKTWEQRKYNLII